MKNLKLLILTCALYLGMIITMTNIEGEPFWSVIMFMALSLVFGGIMGWLAARENYDVMIMEDHRVTVGDMEMDLPIKERDE